MAAEMVPPVSSGSRCLEVGGGAGEFAEILRSKGFSVSLVDLSNANVARAEDAGFDSLQVDLNEGLEPFPTGAFDVVSMLEIIEHVVKAEFLLGEVRRVLRPGGVLILSTPNHAWFRERVAAVLGRPPTAEGYHYRFFTVASLRKILIGSGFEIAEVRFSMPAFGVNLLRRKLLGETHRHHIRLASPFGQLMGQTIYVSAIKIAR